MYIKTAGCMADRIDPDQTLQNVDSYLSLLCLLRPVCPNISNYYGYKDSLVFRAGA